MKKIFALFLLVGCGVAHGSLIDRGGGFIYDDVLNVTWLTDANYAQTSGYDADGLMTWYTAMAWADGLSLYDSLRGVTYDDWRLPSTMLFDYSCDYVNFDSLYGSGDSYGYNCVGSEMGHLYNVNGDQLGLFTNLQSDTYWSNRTQVVYAGNAYTFQFDVGFQGAIFKGNDSYALAVRDGDVGASVVPIPAAVWLFASGLGLLGWMRRSRS